MSTRARPVVGRLCGEAAVESGEMLREVLCGVDHEVGDLAVHRADIGVARRIDGNADGEDAGMPRLPEGHPGIGGGVGAVVAVVARAAVADEDEQFGLHRFAGEMVDGMSNGGAVAVLGAGRQGENAVVDSRIGAVVERLDDVKIDGAPSST